MCAPRKPLPPTQTHLSLREPPASLPQVICQSPPHFPLRQLTHYHVFSFKLLFLYFALFLSLETVFASVSIYFGFTKGRSWCLIRN